MALERQIIYVVQHPGGKHQSITIASRHFFGRKKKTRAAAVREAIDFLKKYQRQRLKFKIVRVRPDDSVPEIT